MVKIEITTEEKIQGLASFMHNQLQSTDERFIDGLPIYGPGLKYIFTCMGVATDDQCRIWIMDNSGNWTQVRPGQVYADFILDKIEMILMTKPIIVRGDVINGNQVLIAESK